VAERLGVSVSTVRRYEGERLHPTIGADGVRTFDPAEVAALAAEVLDAAPGLRNARPAPAPELPAGELAARVFERLEQRQSLTEIVVGLRVTPATVRELHREWQLGLMEGELQHRKPVVPVDDYRRERERFVSAAAFAGLLADLPLGQRTRISVARNLGEYMVEQGEARCVVELGGFVVLGPIEPTDIASRYGSGDYRVTAYGFEPAGVRWEVFTGIDRALEEAALVPSAAFTAPAATVAAARVPAR
jgi:hypothetical protein